MIRSLHVENYLSLKDVDLELRQRNVLIGPNMSGKSNLIDCFKFLTQMVSSGLNKALLDRGGFSEVVWKGGEESRVSFHLTVDNREAGQEAGKIYDYYLSIIGSPTGLVSVEREKLEVEIGLKNYQLIDLSNGQGQVTHPDGSSAFSPPGPDKSALEFTVPGWEGTTVKNYISAFKFYRLLPDLMRQANAATEQQFLSERGENLSSWFLTLYTKYPSEFERMSRAAKDVLPDLQTILVPPTQFGTTYMIAHEKHLKRPVSIWRMSDGELQFLALLSLIFAPSHLGATLYCVEELETHLHPRLLETLVELLNQRQYELGTRIAQHILTTHSPHLLDKMQIEDLIVVEKRDGATRCTRPASKGHLRELLEREELGLGDLWYSGALGES